MKPSRRLLVIPAALAVCGVVCGMYVIGKGRSPSGARYASAPSPSVDSRGSQPAPAESESAGAAQGMAKHRPAQPELKDGPAPSRECPVPQRKVAGSDPGSSGPVLSEAQWRANAAQVEREANHELRHLSTLLDLDPVQQDQVFSSLVQNSPYWLPGMRNGGLAKTSDPGSSSKVGAPDDSGSAPQHGKPVAKAPEENSGEAGPELSSYLNADQQKLLAQEQSEREEWWAEVLPQLLPPALGGDTPGMGGAPGAGDPPPDTKEFSGEEILEGE